MLALNEKLSCMPKKEIEERLTFYSEIIDDRMEEGLSEEEAVAAIGDTDEIAKGIMAESSQVKPENDPKPEEKTKRRLSGLEITLLVLGIPVWIPLISAAFVISLSLYVFAWAILISLWACFGVLAIGSPCLLVLGIVQIISSQRITGIALIGAALACAGITVFAFYGCLALSKLVIRLTVWSFKRIARLFSKKEVA
jgi:uncharacterized membrane protein